MEKPTAFRVTVQLRYPWPPQVPEEQQVSFVLSGEYGCRTREEAREAVRSFIRSGDPGIVLDADGVAWPFFRDTVISVDAELMA